MVRLANQLVQVLASYATRPYTWGSIWVPLGCVAFAFQVNSDDPAAFSLFAGFFAGTIFADLVRDQTRLQFAHARSALLPSFALSHLLAIVPFAVCATILTPAIITMTLTGDFLFMAAFASLTFALISGQYKFIHSEYLRTLFPTLMVVAILILYQFGLGLWRLRFKDIIFTPTNYFLLLAASWTYMAANFVKLVRIRENESDYQASHRSTADWRTGTGHWYLQGLIAGKTWYTQKWRLSDMWNDRIGGFHHGSRPRIIRLLRRASSPWPPELPAVGILTFCAGCVVLFSFAEMEMPQLVFPAPIWRLFPVLIALSFPGPLAAGLVARPRPILAAELMRPLSRKQFVDGLFGTSLWTFAVLWITFNTWAVVVLWTYPGLDPNLSRIPTFVFLSAALSVAIFGFSLYSPPGISLSLRILMNFIFLIIWFTVLPWWWFTRDTATDVPFWIIGAAALSLGLWATRQARLAWLNAELGIYRSC